MESQWMPYLPDRRTVLAPRGRDAPAAIAMLLGEADNCARCLFRQKRHSNSADCDKSYMVRSGRLSQEITFPWEQQANNMYDANTKELQSILILVVVGIACLTSYAAILDSISLPALATNDQVVYIDAARHVLHEGQLTTGVIYPSTLRQNYSHNYFYMPGHALVIALSLWLIGDSVVASLLPSILAYLLCIILLYWIGSRLVNRTVGFMAGFLFAIFPANIIYGVSALSEMTFVCAGLIAFAVFLYLPIQLRPWLGPVLVCVPVLFRETGVFWIIPMAAVILQESRGSKRYVEVLVLLGLSMALLMLIFQLDWIKDRPSRFYLNLLAKNFQEWYMDAFTVELKRPKSLAGWLDILSARTILNLKELWWSLHRPFLEAVLLNVLLWPPFFALVALKWLPSLRNFIAAYILMALVMFAFLSLFYVWDEFIGVRLLLMLFPLEAIVVACAFDYWCRTSLQRGAILCVLALLALLLSLANERSEKRSNEAQLAAFSPILSTISPDPSGVLVSNWRVGALYVYENYPAKWAFVPANERTLELLHEKYPVATAVLDKADIQRLGVKALEKIGLVYSMEVVGPNGSAYSVFRRPP